MSMRAHLGWQHISRTVPLLSKEHAQAEAVATAKAGEQVAYAREVLRALGVMPEGPTPILTDNLGNCLVSRDATSAARAKHFLRRYASAMPDQITSSSARGPLEAGGMHVVYRARRVHYTIQPGAPSFPHAIHCLELLSTARAVTVSSTVPACKHLHGFVRYRVSS